MADLTPEQAIEKLRTLPEDKQRAVLGRLSPEARKGILGKLTAKAPGKTPPEVAPDRFAQDRDITEQWAAKHPILGPVARFAVTAGQNAASAIADAPSNAYHAFADPATPEETKRYGADQVTGAKRVGLGVGRLFGREQAENAIEDYSSGKVTPAAAKEVLPEALGTGVGQVAGGAVYGKGTEIVSDGLNAAGKLRTKMANSTARKITGVEPALKEATSKAAEKYGEDVETNKAKRAETMKQNLETQRAARTDIDRQKMAIGEKNKGIESENKAQADKVSQRETLEKQVDTQSKELHEHLTKVEQSVAKEANAKFDAVRAKIGNPEAPGDELVSTVKNVEQNVLQNIPENIKEFRAIMQHEPLPEGIKNAAEAHGFDLEGTEPLTWEKLQSLKSRMDARLRNGRNMNGDLKRALYQTREAVVGEMGKMADANGASGEWGAARDAWRQYKEDFHEGTGPSGSGSPVAQALNAEDPKNIRQPFLRTQSAIGNRGVDILRKYPQHGGDVAANHVENLVKNHQSMLELPSKEAPKVLKETPQAFQLPENKGMPARPETPTVDASKVARDAIAQRAKNWGSFNARDIGIIASGGLGELLGGLFGSSPFDRALGAATGVGMYEGAKYYTSRALNNPRVIEWLSRTPAEEVAVLNKIPGADKVKIVNTLTDAAVSGKATNLSPAARQLLGPANVAKILAATGAGVVQNRREARERLGQPSN